MLQLRDENDRLKMQLLEMATKLSQFQQKLLFSEAECAKLRVELRCEAPRRNGQKQTFPSNNSFWCAGKHTNAPRQPVLQAQLRRWGWSLLR